MGEKIKIGVLGCANIAFRSVIPAIKGAEEFELVAVASRTKDKAEHFANYFHCEPVVGYDNLVLRDDIEALYIPLPTGLHEEWVTKALANNKHVLTEKSLSMNLVSAEKMLADAKQFHLVLMEDFMYRFHSQHAFVWEQIRNNVIGELRLFKSSFGFPPLNQDNFRYDEPLGGGAVLDAAAYTVDAARWFLGNDLELGVANLFLERSTNVCIHGSASLYSKSTGLAAQISFGFDNFYQCNYEIWGSKGMIFCERSFTPPPDMRPKVIVTSQRGPIEHILSADNHFSGIIRQFAYNIKNVETIEQGQDLFHQCRLLNDLRSKAIVTYI